MSKKKQGKRRIWRGRRRDTELFTSSLKQQIPNLVSVHISAGKTISCEVELINNHIKSTNVFSYGRLKGGE